MELMNCVEMIVERKKYTRDGIHKGMQGWICMDDRADILGAYLVDFPQMGAKGSIATISVDKEDMKVVPTMDARINEQIKAQFDAPKQDVRP